MYIKEHFLSIQGEGRFSGERSIFIRFAKCNRTCSEFKISYLANGKEKLGCDSYDSVDTAFKDNWKEVSFHDLIDIVKNYDCKNIVLTGGEPLLNIKNNEFIDFIMYLLAKKYKVTIETNGDMDIKVDDEVFNLLRKVIFSISPKDRIQSKDYWILNKDSYIKAVYNFGDVDTSYLNSLKALGMDIFIMPNGNNCDIVNGQKKEILRYCMENGFNFSDRLHIGIFKNDSHIEARIMNNAHHDKFINRI